MVVIRPQRWANSTLYCEERGAHCMKVEMLIMHDKKIEGAQI